MKLRDYEALVRDTDRFANDDILPITLGLFGEVGGVFAAAKKQKREGPKFIKYKRDVEEEFGDVLWYFVALCRRCKTSLTRVLCNIGYERQTGGDVAAGTFDTGQILLCINLDTGLGFEACMRELGKQAGVLLDIADNPSHQTSMLEAFCRAYIRALNAAHLDFQTVAEGNVKKVRGRFLQPAALSLPTFDEDFPEDERIPDSFEIEMVEKADGKTYLKWNGVFVGDPLSDNIGDSDGFRYHDVFHFAHAAVLHWSPTFRSLIRHKRKSNSRIEEEQDSGRAIVVEEGLTAWIFSQAKQLALFEGHSGVSFDLLKSLSEFVQGYEVEQCPLSLWEDAILQGYNVFRSVLDRGGGVVVGERKARKIYLKD